MDRPTENSLGDMSLGTMESTGKIQEPQCFGKRPLIVLDFADLSCFMTARFQENGRKQVLRGISGNFKSGQLTAIMGTSGAGKSTLLNILTGYTSVDVVGSIKVNGHLCQMENFRKLCSYIMQDSVVQPYLTVEESLNIVADLKLGRGITKKQRVETVNQILETLGLENSRRTRIEKLSGGQTKRVAIALELVNNPPVIFLDEPTTSLDVVSTTKVIEVLQKLARQGRAVICTVHQPSAHVCEYFDHMYFMTQGICIYQGSFQKLVPFMSSVGYECPDTHNPADFILELIHSNLKSTSTLSQAVKNGKVSIESAEAENNDRYVRGINEQQGFSFPVMYRDDSNISVSFFKQVAVLLERKMKQQFRNRASLFIMTLHHILTGIILGVMFYGVGGDGSRPFANFKFLISVVVFFMYTHIMGPVLLFPFEVKIMRVEYFNRWYSLKAYFTALTISTLHFHVILGPIFILIAYILSDQPIDISRILFFITIGFLLGVTSEGWGLTIGSLFNSRNGSIVGPASVVPLLAVSVYGMGFGKVIKPFNQHLMNLSYLRYGVVGFATSVYGLNRTLVCDYDANVYCHYLDSRLLLSDLGMEDSSPMNQAVALFVFFVLHRLTAFLGLKYRTSFDFSHKLMNFTTKVFLRRKKWST